MFSWIKDLLCCKRTINSSSSIPDLLSEYSSVSDQSSDISLGSSAESVLSLCINPQIEEVEGHRHLALISCAQFHEQLRIEYPGLDQTAIDIAHNKYAHSVNYNDLLNALRSYGYEVQLRPTKSRRRRRQR